MLVSLAFIIFMHWKFGWYALEPVLIAQIILILAIGPLVPDIDHESGKLHKWLIGAGLFIAVAGLIFYYLQNYGLLLSGGGWTTLLIAGLALAVATFLTSHFANHRGFWHSIPLCLLFGLVIYILVGFHFQLGVLGFVACYSHLLGDNTPFKFK